MCSIRVPGEPGDEATIVSLPDGLCPMLIAAREPEIQLAIDRLSQALPNRLIAIETKENLKGFS